MADRSQIAMAVEQIKAARSYTTRLLDGLDESDWFQMPPGAGSHIAWQVGHLAMAQYALTMLRIRGKEPEDAEWISNSFFRTFQKGTLPNSDRSVYPTKAGIMQVFEAVHRQAMRELPSYRDEDLQESLPAPTFVMPTKLGSILFCSAHEMLHAGQIGMLRRMLGKPAG